MKNKEELLIIVILVGCILLLGVSIAKSLNKDFGQEILWLNPKVANSLEAQSSILESDLIRYDSIARGMGYRGLMYGYVSPGPYNSDTLWTASVIRSASKLGNVPELFTITLSNEDSTYRAAVEGLFLGLDNQKRLIDAR